MKHVLLTGATGFLGSHLLEALLGSGHRVTILKRSTSDTWRINHLINDVTSFDVDKAAVESAFKATSVDAVIHTACCYGRHGQPANEVVESNLLFGLKVLDAATQHNVSVFINTDTLLPKDLNTYSLSKKQFVEWLKQRSCDIKVINLRLEHMYGPRDDQTKFVPWLIAQLEQGVERIPLTEGSQKRDFIYIDDVVSAYMIVLDKAEQLTRFTDLDVGTGQLTPVREFVEALYESYIQKYPSSKTQLGFGDIAIRDGELMSIKINNRGLKNLGWTPEVQQAEGLANILKVKG